MRAKMHDKTFFSTIGAGRKWDPKLSVAVVEVLALGIDYHGACLVEIWQTRCLSRRRHAC